MTTDELIHELDTSFADDRSVDGHIGNVIAARLRAADALCDEVYMATTPGIRVEKMGLRKAAEAYRKASEEKS
jgi:hypothetical protein